MYRKNSYARLIFIITVLAICSIVILRYNKVASNDRKTLNTIEKYGIFLGVEKENLKKIKDYYLIVIDADNLDKDDIKSLKKQGNKKIFSYINIGSVEEFREYYNDFKNLTLEDYENWEDEKWVDITNKKWKKHIANLSKKMKFKGIDGFFADNTDVYYHYKDPKVYSSLLEILTDIKKTGLPCIVNGGDTFISKAISENTLKDLVYGINQETVLTKIDFKNNAFYTSSNDTREYFEKYLKKCKDFGLKIYLTEYTRDEKIKNKIRDFCKKNRYNCYISSTIELSKIDE